MVIYPKNGDEIVVWKETGPEEPSGDNIVKIIEMVKAREIEIIEGINSTYSKEVLGKYSKKVRSDIEIVMKYFGKL